MHHLLRALQLPSSLVLAFAISGCEPPPPEPTSQVEHALLGIEVCPAGSNIIEGTPGDDVLDGTNGRDCIFGHGGNDTIRGGNGDDVLVGGAGDDTLEGGSGADRLEGEAGNDVIDGGNGDDVISGGDGNDVLDGGNGADEIDGGAGHDVLRGGSGADDLAGGDGDDVIDDGAGADAVDGGSGTDACSGSNCERPIPAVVSCTTDSQCGAGLRCALPAGICIACLADLECDDGNACTADACQPVLGCASPNHPDGTACPDATLCNGDETCTAGSCTAGTPLVCDDGQYCNGVESCDPLTACQPGTPPVIDDGVACTDDSCNEATDVVVNQTNDAHCSIGFVCEPAGCTPWCTQIEVTPGVTRCVAAPGDGTVSLHLSPGDLTPWEQQYVQADEPEPNFCGPTAGRNLLFWYGHDVSYATFAAGMRTNEWEEGIGLFALAVAVCGGDFVICAPIVYTIASDSLINAGSLPADVASSLTAQRPAGYGFCASQGSNALAPIRNALERGSPVYYLESRGEGNLHWAVLTGLYDDAGVLSVRVANSTERPWDEFVADWSISKVGGGIVRSLLAGLGLQPYIRYYYTAPGQPCE
ncbi:MAG: hypothetical protein M3680_16895 [Myxococcota bacterium]|nr:hypothetical protein [Myxococcota bacterium]